MVLKHADYHAMQGIRHHYYYLEVVGEGSGRHLVVKEKGFFGRLWMWLGFGPASMSSVTSYLLETYSVSCSGREIQRDAGVVTFMRKLGRYTQHHTYCGHLTPTARKAQTVYQTLARLETASFW